MGASIFDWSLVSGDNANSDADLTWAEGQAPGTVNASARTMMKRVAELLADLGGTLTAGGSANVLTVTANSAFDTYANGRMVSFKAASDNTGAATLNVNSIGAKSLRRATIADGDAELVAGNVQAGCIYVAIYNTSLNGGAGGWALVNETTSFAGYVSLTGTETLENKTLTAPTINGGTMSQPTLTLKQGASEAPTAEGDIRWDSDDNRLVIGDGAATKTFTPNPASTAAGDIEYYTAANTKARLAKGTAAQVLKMNSGATAPEWADKGYDFYTGSSANETDLPIGSVIIVQVDSVADRNESKTIYRAGTTDYQTSSVGGTVLSGTWRARGRISSSPGIQMFQRTA